MKCFREGYTTNTIRTLLHENTCGGGQKDTRWKQIQYAFYSGNGHIGFVAASDSVNSQSRRCRTLLHCTALYCTVQYCTALYSTVLYQTYLFEKQFMYSTRLEQVGLKRISKCLCLSRKQSREKESSSFSVRMNSAAKKFIPWQYPLWCDAATRTACKEV